MVKISGTCFNTLFCLQLSSCMKHIWSSIGNCCSFIGQLNVMLSLKVQSKISPHVVSIWIRVKIRANCELSCSTSDYDSDDACDVCLPNLSQFQYWASLNPSLISLLIQNHDHVTFYIWQSKSKSDVELGNVNFLRPRKFPRSTGGFISNGE